MISTWIRRQVTFAPHKIWEWGHDIAQTIDRWAGRARLNNYESRCLRNHLLEFQGIDIEEWYQPEDTLLAYVADHEPDILAQYDCDDEVAEILNCYLLD